MTQLKTTPDTQALGHELAVLLSWDCLAILLTAKATLTDANFHTEARALESLISDNLPL